VTTRREHPLIFDLMSNASVMKGGMDFFKGVGRKMGMEEEDMQKFFHITTEAEDFLEYLKEIEFDYDITVIIRDSRYFWCLLLSKSNAGRTAVSGLLSVILVAYTLPTS
jgi:hypothetical protein